MPEEGAWRARGAWEHDALPPPAGSAAEPYWIPGQRWQWMFAAQVGVGNAARQKQRAAPPGRLAVQVAQLLLC